MDRKKLKQKIRRKYRQKEDASIEEIRQEVREEIRQERQEGFYLSRRDFLKTLGLGAGGLVLSSSAAAGFARWLPGSLGTSEIDGDTVDGKHASELAGGTVDRASSTTQSGTLKLTGGSPNYVGLQYSGTNQVTNGFTNGAGGETITSTFGGSYTVNQFYYYGHISTSKTEGWDMAIKYSGGAQTTQIANVGFQIRDNNSSNTVTDLENNLSYPSATAIVHYFTGSGSSLSIQWDFYTTYTTTTATTLAT